MINHNPILNPRHPEPLGSARDKLRRGVSKILKSTYHSRIAGTTLLLTTTLLYSQTLFSVDSVSSVRDTITTDSTLPAMSEADVVTVALHTSRRLQSLKTNVDIAGHRLSAAGWIDNPEFRFSEEIHQYRTDKIDERQYALRWRFPELGEQAEDKQQARADWWERKVRARRERDQHTARVRRTFTDVLTCDRLADLAEQRIAIEDKRIAIVEKMVDLGNRSVVYFTKAKMWHAESRNDLARAIQRKNMERRKLAKQAGIPAETPLLADALASIETDVDSLIEIAFANRPEIIWVDQRIELAVRQNRYEHLQLVPWPTFIQVSYHEELDRDEDWREFRVGFNLPLFDWNIGNIKATRLAVQRREYEADAIRESIAEEVRSAFIIYKDLLLDWQNFKTYAEDLIRQADKVITEARKHDTLMPDEVLEMELTVIETQKLTAEKKRDLIHARIDLEYAMGVEYNPKESD